MHVKVQELMTPQVVTARPHTPIERVRGLLERNGIGAVPIVDSEDQPVGIVSATDLAADLRAGSPISSVMTETVYTVPQYDDVSIAARVMRNHSIHRVVVTHEQKVVGMLSSFDLLKLVEQHRFVDKNAPTVKKKKARRRK
jgi:CBS domain-containing protein